MPANALPANASQQRQNRSACAYRERWGEKYRISQVNVKQAKIARKMPAKIRGARCRAAIGKFALGSPAGNSDYCDEFVFSSLVRHGSAAAAAGAIAARHRRRWR